MHYFYQTYRFEFLHCSLVSLYIFIISLFFIDTLLQPFHTMVDAVAVSVVSRFLSRKVTRPIYNPLLLPEFETLFEFSCPSKLIATQNSRAQYSLLFYPLSVSVYSHLLNKNLISTPNWAANLWLTLLEERDTQRIKFIKFHFNILSMKFTQLSEFWFSRHTFILIYLLK